MQRILNKHKLSSSLRSSFILISSVFTPDIEPGIPLSGWEAGQTAFWQFHSFFLSAPTVSYSWCYSVIVTLLWRDVSRQQATQPTWTQTFGPNNPTLTFCFPAESSVPRFKFTCLCWLWCWRVCSGSLFVFWWFCSLACLSLWCHSA